MGWDRLPLPTFEKARRRDIYRKLSAAVRGADSSSEELPSLDEVQRRLRLFDQRYVGIQPIPVAAVVGTVDRRPEFVRGFLPKDIDTRARWREIEQAFPLSDFPPIVVYKVGDAYFVVDGHHRVGVAKQRQIEYIDAEVTELESRVPLDPKMDIAEVIHREQQMIFMDESGLGRSRPKAEIEFTRTLGYVELLDLVKVFGYHLMQERGRALDAPEVAAAWYDDVYGPTIEVFRQEGVLEAFPSATQADMFLWVYQRRQALFPELGGMTMQEAARHLKDRPE
jgi:hypothetical protein